MQGGVHACAHACLRACTNQHAYMHAYIQTCKHTQKHVHAASPNAPTHCQTYVQSPMKLHLEISLRKWQRHKLNLFNLLCPNKRTMQNPCAMTASALFLQTFEWAEQGGVTPGAPNLCCLSQRVLRFQRRRGSSMAWCSLLSLCMRLTGAEQGGAGLPARQICVVFLRKCCGSVFAALL